jgi:hypothetical protein
MGVADEPKAYKEWSKELGSKYKADVFHDSSI